MWAHSEWCCVEEEEYEPNGLKGYSTWWSEEENPPWWSAEEPEQQHNRIEIQENREDTKTSEDNDNDDVEREEAMNWLLGIAKKKRTNQQKKEDLRRDCLQKRLISHLSSSIDEIKKKRIRKELEILKKRLREQHQNSKKKVVSKTAKQGNKNADTKKR